MYRHDFIKRMRFIPYIIHQDVFYTLDLLKKTTRYGKLNKVLYNYNVENYSIIRSAYSKNKIDNAIRATDYIKNNVPNLVSIQRSVKQYIVNHYTNHFYLLSKNKKIDIDRKYRVYLKKQIKDNLLVKEINFRTAIIILFPIIVIENLFKVHFRY